jgi:hypothetical protein
LALFSLAAYGARRRVEIKRAVQGAAAAEGRAGFPEMAAAEAQAGRRPSVLDGSDGRD